MPFIELFRNAPRIALVSGAIAFLLGTYGLLAALMTRYQYRRDARRFSHALSEAAAEHQGEQLDGPLTTSLMGVIEVPFIGAGLSPDATWEYIRGRLESTTEGRIGVFRFFSYAPLLVGLFGTMVGLAQLLPFIGPNSPTGGVTTEVAAAARQALQGVFAGTLGGILGSLLASIGTLGFSRAADRVVAQCEVLVQRELLPRIPERRISIKIEQAVLDVIIERSAAVVAQYGEVMKPLAESLTNSARESASAAKEASEAFHLAATAVRQAGNLERTAKHLGTGLEKIARASEGLDNAAQTIAGTANAQSESVAQLRAAADQVADASKQVNNAASMLRTDMVSQARTFGDAATGLSAAITGFGADVCGVKSAFGGLAEDVKARNRIEAEVARGVEEQGREFTATVAAVKGAAQQLNQEVLTLRHVLEGFTKKAVSTINTEMGVKVDLLCNRILETLATISSGVNSAAANVRASGDDLKQKVAEAKVNLPEVVQRVGDLRQLVLDQIKAIDTLQHSPSPWSKQSEIQIDLQPVVRELQRLDSVQQHLQSIYNEITTVTRRKRGWSRLQERVLGRWN